MNKYQDIYDFIKKKESEYQKPIQLEDGWWWLMKEHLRRSFLYKHSQFTDNNENRKSRPFKNIIRAILNIQYRTEGFDVKDIELYVDNPDTYYKSFLARKFHNKWAVDNSIDTFIDEGVESYADYGGWLAKKGREARPIVVDLRSLAFCSQNDILAYPFAIKHEMSAAELREMEEWGKGKGTMDVETLITLAQSEEKDTIDVYELHGVLPALWLDGEEGEVQQIQVVSFYKDQNKNDIGITLFKSKEPKLPFKFLSRDKIYNRALGWGGVEELFEPQRWTNDSEIKTTEMLESASKTLFKTTDPAFKTRNNLVNVENNEVLLLQEGRDITQLDTYPRNLAVFNDAISRWEQHAQQIGAASEGLLGESPSSGTPFKLYEAQNIEARGMHHYRQGKMAVFMDEIYRDWILPRLAEEIADEQKFLAELSADEVMEVVDKIVDNQVAKQRKEQALNGELPSDPETLKEPIRQKLLKKGNRWFIDILKDEFKGEKLGISTNIAGKQKNLALITDKLVNILRQFISTPEIRQDPEMVKLLNTILESSGMSPIMFGGIPRMEQPATGGGTEPLKALGKATVEAAKPI